MRIWLEQCLVKYLYYNTIFPVRVGISNEWDNKERLKHFAKKKDYEMTWGNTKRQVRKWLTSSGVILLVGTVLILPIYAASFFVLDWKDFVLFLLLSESFIASLCLAIGMVKTATEEGWM